MARVLDLSTDDDGVLHRTDASGLFSSGHLAAAPLSSHLADAETARYLLGNKKAGVTVADGDDETSYEPDPDYRAFTVVTDRRLLFVAGRAEGDETLSLPLTDVYTVGTESAGLLSTALVVEASDGRQFSFPCRGDLGPVVETLRSGTATEADPDAGTSGDTLPGDAADPDDQSAAGGEADASVVADAIEGVDVRADDGADVSGERTEAPPGGVADAEGAAADAAAVDRLALADALRARSDAELTALIAEVWSARGWATTPFEAGGEAVYDLLAVCPDSETRLLLWVCHRPDGGAIGADVLDRIAATRERSTDPVRATVVTTGSVPTAVRERAVDADVSVVDSDGLCDLVVATGLADAVLGGL